MRHEARRPRRWRRRLAVAGGITAAVSVLGLLWLVRASGVPVVNPIYQIETISNGHRQSLPLELGRPGVPAVPRPVDVNRDGIQDVIVAVNLVDVKALLGLPPDAGEVLAPTLEITRNPAAVALCKPDIKLLSKCTPPLKILIKLTVQDSSNLQEDMVVSFGYDTGNDGGVPYCAAAPCPDNKGRIGSIPPYFKAVLLGLDDFFNPITAQVTTHGYAIVGTPLIDNEAKNGYEGPLDLVGSIGTSEGILSPDSGGLFDSLIDLINPQDTPTAEMRFGYRPWPGTISVSYSSDDEGDHVVYDHARKSGVDLHTNIGVFSRDGDVLSSSVLQARIDRLPRHITLDFLTDEKAGKVRYSGRSDGRRPDISLSALSEKLQVVPLPAPPPSPDVEAKLKARLAGYQVKAHAALFIGYNDPEPEVQLVPLEPPLLADVDVESFPSVIEGRWSFPTGGPVSALFCGGEVDEADQCQPSGLGIGAVDAHVQDFYAAPAAVTPFTPTEQQFLSFRNAPGGAFESESLIAGRIEQIRELRFDQSQDGFSARTRLGDGELPLELDLSTDEREGTEGALVNVGATIVPLPDDITISVQEPGEDQLAQPLAFAYDSSKSVDINSRVNIRQATGGATCGQFGTVCGELRARHIPAHIAVRVFTFPADISDDDTDDTFNDSRVEIDTTPREGTDVEPDFFADLTIGQEDMTPTNFADDVPLVAQGELLGLPRFVRIRAREGGDETLDRVEFHSCDRDYDATPPSCVAGTEDPNGIASVAFRLRNWTTRPADLPILVPGTPIYATLAVRGKPAPSTDVNFEAIGKMTDIRELQYRNTGRVFGLRSRIGADQRFSAKVDIANIDFPDDDPANGRIDAMGEATISPLPGFMDFCFRSAHEAIQTLADPYTDACETNNPFGDDAPLTETPTTVHYNAPNQVGTGFDVATKLLLRQQGPTAAVGDNHTIRGRLSVDNLPSRVTVNFQAPKEDDGDNVVEEGETGPIRGKFDGTPGSPVSLDFGVEVTDGDLVCEDPRTPGIGKKAMCASGIIQDLPTNAFFRYDPTVKTDNLEVTTNTQIDLTDLTFSSVEGARRCEVILLACFFQPVAKVLVAEADVNDLPSSVTGTLDLPKTESDEEEAPTVDITATPAIGSIDATVRNFIAPNPFVKPIPSRTVSGFGAPTQTATFRQRGKSFLATAHIEDVRRVGYRTVKAADGTPLETKVINVDFGSGTEVIRAYADIMESPAAQTIADAQINDIPAGLQVCFRGDANTKSPAPGTATYCDIGDSNIPVANTDGKDQTSGAIQFIGTPDTPAASPLDVDAFVRHAAGGGTQVLAGRVHIDNIPFVVQGTFPTDADTGQLDMGGFRRSGTSLVPDGIDKIEAQVASFDLATADTGFSSLPYEPRFNDNGPFPVLASTKQHLKAALVDDDFHARARLGPESQIQRLKMLRTFCSQPSHNPPDYPRFPNGPNDKYTCIQGIFNPSTTDSDPAGGFDDQLDLQFHMEKAGSVISVNEAGITDIPSNFQVTVAETPLFEGAGDNLRKRCGTVSEAAVNGGNCMPPLIRFDQPDRSILWGTARIGTVGDLAKLEPTAIPPIVPRAEEDMANLDAVPTSTTFPGWGTPPAGVPANEGIRAKIVGFKGGSTAVKAGIRLAIPQSLTVDQVQSWSDSDSSEKERYWQASDTRFHYIVRDSAGNPVGSLGQLSLMKQSDDGTQILASAPCLSAYGARANDPGNCGAFNNGISIPGELGIDIYQRNHTGRGKDYMQIDGRVSQLKDTNGNNVPFHLGARIVGGGPKPAIGRLEAQVKNVPQGGDPGDPSFRLRVEMLGEGEAPPTAGGGGGGGGGGEEEENCGVFLCALTDVRLKSIFALFDFRQARMVEAVVNQKGATSQGIEVKSWKVVRNPQPSDATPILVKALLDVNPINVFLHAGLPLIGGADFVLMSQLQAGLTLDTQHFTLRHNTLHVEADNEGPKKSVIGPINYYIYVMHGSAYALFVKLFGIDFLPPSAPPELGLPPGGTSGPVQLVFLSCDLGDLFTQLTNLVTTFPDPFDPANPLSNALDVGSSGRNVVIWPLLDPRIHFSGVFGFLGNIAKIIGPFFCFTDTGPSEIPLFGSGVPGDPLGSNFLPNHDGPPDTDDDSTAAPSPGPGAVTPPPNFTTTASVSLCGVHAYTNLTVASGHSITVATQESSAENTVPGRADCPPGSEGTLNIVADKVTVNGTITGSERIPTLQPDGTLPTGNSGAGHGGKGGDGSNGSGGGTYDDVDENGLDNTSDTDDDGRPTLTGGRGRGGGDGTSHGGASIEIQARDVIVHGQIIARGKSGISGAAGDSGNNCANAGTGDGGGSGGRIVISAFDVWVNPATGIVSVTGGSGGSGGNGGGGGGGAGRLLVEAPLLTGTGGVDFFANGGGQGNDSCTVNGDNDGKPGEAWNLDKGPGKHLDTSVKSVVTPLGQFWNRDESSQGANLSLPYEAAAAGGGTNGVQVVICGYSKAPSAIDPTKPLNEQFPVPDPVLAGFGVDVCGGKQRIVVDSFTADRHSEAAATQGSDLTDGYWGTWSIAFSPPDPDYDCTDGSIFDFFVCEVEPFPNPKFADLVFGIDNSDPSLSVNPPADNATGHDFVTNQSTIKLTPAATDQPSLSNLRTVECTNDASAPIEGFVTCNNGENDWPLATGSDGARLVTVQAIDFAGNTTQVDRDGLLDKTLPTQSASFVGGTLNNGWYRVRPGIQLDGSDPGAAAASGLASPAFRYRFDDGAEESCGGGVPCAIDQNDINALFVGQHTLHFTAQDIAGNRRFDDEDAATPGPMATKAIKLDDEAPLSAFLTVPGKPNGANGWFEGQPFVTFSAVDQPGASGFNHADAGIFYSFTGPGGPFTKYSGVPFLLGPGSHNVCWYSKDVAGNQEGTQCTTDPIRVDDAAPTVTIAAPAPNGLNDWYTSSPTAVVTASDSSPGSSINPAFDPDLTDLCTGEVPQANPLTPSGMCVSLDGGPFQPQASGTPMVIAEGLHSIRAFAVDVSGQRSPVVERDFKVDRSDPVTAARAITPAPVRNGWFRTIPRVVLRAADGERNAGVSRIEYFIDAVGPTLYSGPFAVPEGVHVVKFQATDLSGRVEALRAMTVKVDVGPAVVRALASQPLAFAPAAGQKTTLKWTVVDNLSHTVQANVIIYNNLGLVVRRLQDVPKAVSPNVTATDSIKWDGRDDGLAGLVPLGTYYYRVFLTDEAGHISMTGESAPLTVKAG